MSYRSLLHALRLPAIAANDSADDDWRPPSPDTRYTLPEGPMECVYVAICDEREFFRALEVHARAGRIMGPVLYMRLYQRRQDRTPEYSVWFTAVIELRYSRVELRRHCGEQDLTQCSDNAPASQLAARMQADLAAACTLLGIECREARYEEIR